MPAAPTTRWPRHVLLFAGWFFLSFFLCFRGVFFCSCVSRVSLFHVRGQDAALRQTLEPFERVVDEDPVLVLGGRTLAAAVLSVFGVGCRSCRKRQQFDQR